MGDDIRPRSPAFFQAHLEAHARYVEPYIAALGKVIWPDRQEEQINFVMSHIQGPGVQQFGYYCLKPYSWLDWSLFWTANISVKRSIVSDWLVEGFDSRFRLAAWEDIEFAYRAWKADDRFRILYVPRSVGAHHHHYNLKGFLERQVVVGLSHKTFVELHPEIADRFAPDVAEELAGANGEGNDLSLLPDYAAVIEGIKSFGYIHDAFENLGSKNWHPNYLKALFQLAFEQGIVIACDDPQADLACAYRGIIQRFVDTMSESMETEILGQYIHAFNPMSIRSLTRQRPPAPPPPRRSLLHRVVRRIARQVPFARPMYRLLKRTLASH